MNEIFGLIQCYLKLKDDYKEYHKENLYDVFEIFNSEVCELDNIIFKIDRNINSTNDSDVKQTIYDNEENLVNEIADVLFTTARLIKEFKLEEPLSEMMEYKYHRQLVRELKRFKNNE